MYTGLIGSRLSSTELETVGHGVGPGLHGQPVALVVGNQAILIAGSDSAHPVIGVPLDLTLDLGDLQVLDPHRHAGSRGPVHAQVLELVGHLARHVHVGVVEHRLDHAAQTALSSRSLTNRNSRGMA